MTGSDIVEEILYNSYAIGIADDVFAVAKVYIEMGMGQKDSYEKAFIKILEEKSKEDPR
jgi:hypothetical protein